MLLYPACIEVLVDDDNSGDLKAVEKKKLAPFHLADTGKEQTVDHAGQIVFQEINADQIKSQLKLGKKTWIYVWGSWCTPCCKRLPLIAQIHRDNPDWNIVPVADDYVISTLQKLLYTSRLSVQPYILDYRRYGNNTHEKIRKLWEELTPGPEFTLAFPQNYLYDADGRLLYYGTGRIPDDLMQQYFVLK